MKPMLRNLFMIALTVLMAVPVCAQENKARDRKAERMARREQRREERAVMDAIRAGHEYEDSVNVGYGYVKRRNMNSSVSSLDVNKDQIASYSHIGEYLMGRVPGLTVNKIGDNKYEYVIRGTVSFKLSTDPLFVVDGIVVSEIDYLNPYDVKSVEILKDASASIYGSRAAGGVIMITTRKE